MIIRSLLVFTVQRNRGVIAQVIQDGRQQKSLNLSAMISSSQSLLVMFDLLLEERIRIIPSAWAYTYAKDGKPCASTSKTPPIFHAAEGGGEAAGQGREEARGHRYEQNHEQNQAKQSIALHIKPDVLNMVQIRVGNDEHEISNNPRCNVGSTKILFFEDTSPYSWTEAWRLALARGGRLPTLTECRDYIAKNGGFFTENLWMPVTSPISPDESITRVQIEGTPNSGAEYCRIGHSDSSVWGQGHFADLNTGYDPINLLDAWGTGAHQKMLGVVRDEGIPWKDGDLTVKDIGCFATGKYVWIYTYTSFSQMNFAKVEIMGIEQPWKNLARSCTYGACPSDSNIGFPTGGTDLQKTQNPSRAVDGLFLRHSAFYAGGSVDDPWWRVELQSRADVKMVRITGQMDFASGNNDVDIRVGDSPIPFKNPVCASGVTRSTLTQLWSNIATLI